MITRRTDIKVKNSILAVAVAVIAALPTLSSSATVGITEGIRPLVAGTTAVPTTDTSANPANAFNLDTLGTLGPDTFEIYGRIVDSVDNFAFGFSSTSTFKANWIFGGYSLASGAFVSDSGFVAQGNTPKTATFNLLDADNGFSVVSTLTAPTDITSGPSLLFSAGPGNYVLQVDGSGANAAGNGVGLYDIRISAVPLPASALLLIFGVGGLGAMSRRKRD